MGTNCRLCPRLDCTQRAFPPLNHRLVVDENIRSLSSYIGPPHGLSAKAGGLDSSP